MNLSMLTGLTVRMNRKRGLLFDKNNILLDPYARAVAGRRTWGKKRQATYHARVVKDVFDWGRPAAVRPGDE